MLKTELCDFLGIKYPIIQAGMGPFGNNKLSIATANAGILGIIAMSGIDSRERRPGIYKHFVETGGATLEDDKFTVLKKILYQTLNGTREKKGVFGINVLVSAERIKPATEVIDAAIKIRAEDPEMKEGFQVVITSAGDPMPWGDKIKGAGLKWIHVMPSVRAAKRCQKAGVDVVVASGHEGGFHTAWEPVHSLVLLPAVVEALAGSGILVVGAGGFCDGKSLAAALALGAVGAQMGTRFLATKESDFAAIWKEQVVKTQDRGTLVARGFVGPARWLKTEASLRHQENTLKMSPGVFLGRPDDLDSIPKELYESEEDGINAVYEGDESRALMAGGECAQRVDDMPVVADLVDRIVKEAEETVEALPKKFLI
ncbi:MAG: nitronate monooxygenase [Deltaproteobacteria bacterium]|nr:nitronate monooxygenase [Deltaproteobacteria bacterium]MBW2142416.1 nitronate monooxygenase [Deltaproteobacteria bacterium]MBW2324353.1 nitronate monooxygenase [Deltaproteobacteria bacterium]